MGRDLGRPALMQRRALLVAAVVVAALATAGLGAAPAVAADPTPSPNPAHASVPTVSPPSQQQIDDARNALDRLRNQGTKPTLTEVAGPTAPPGPGRASVASRISDQGWWTIGAGALLLLVVSESTRIGVKRAKHRKV